MNIQLNGHNSPTNLITFNSVPNIVSIESTQPQGSKATLTINITNLSTNFILIFNFLLFFYFTK